MERHALPHMPRPAMRKTLSRPCLHCHQGPRCRTRTRRSDTCGAACPASYGLARHAQNPKQTLPVPPGAALSDAHEAERYLWSVTPCLMAWPAVSLAPGPGSLVVGATLGIVYAVDRAFAGKGLLPPWCALLGNRCPDRMPLSKHARYIC